MALSLDGFRVTARTLRKQPVFATVVILSLALAIALNTTMYSVLDALAHPRLDIRQPEQLYRIQFFGDYKHRVPNRDRDAALAAGMHSYDAITRERTSYSQPSVVERGQNIQESKVAGVGENFFDVLGPRVIAGRTFVPADVDAATAPVVISDDLAGQLFPRGESPIGASIQIDRSPYVVIGVISAASNYPHGHTAAWVIAPYDAVGGFDRLIRLRPGASRTDAERELSVVSNRIAAAAGESSRDAAFRFHPAADPEFQVRPFQYTLILSVAAVLLVACANLANLQLARGIGRRRDLALRSALGATRKRIVAHLLGESVLLAAGGLAGGLLLAYLGGRLLTASIPPSMGDYVVEPQMSWRVLLFAVIATVLCLVLVGLAPAIYVSRADPSELLKSGAGTGATKRNRRRYGVLVGVEIALALVLASAAALSVRAALVAKQASYGYDPRPLATGFVLGLGNREASRPYSEILQQIVARVRAVNGVVDAGASSTIRVRSDAVTVEGAGGVREFPAPGYAATMVSPSYLRAMQLPVIKGRDFLDGERDEAVAIVDEQTAHVLWPNANPVGAQIKLGDLKSSAPYVRVVGVVGQQAGFAIDPVYGAVMRTVKNLGRIYYLPGPRDTLDAQRAFGVSFVARAANDAEKLPVAIRRSFQAGGELVGRGVMTMDQALGITQKKQSTRFLSSLFTLFAVLGVALAAFGVYGVVAHSVAERRRELGVRIALGATARDILHAVLRESAVVALAGTAGGLLAVKYAKQYLAAVAFEDDLYNAPLFASVALALGLAAVIAAMIPAMRATRVDPTESLRSD